MSRSCHSAPVFTLAWESVFPDKRERIATTSLRTGFAMTARKRFPAKKGINPVRRTGFIPSATGSGHVITCTARRWVVSGQLYCFQLPPAKGRREACKPFTDPTSRITNVRINRAAAHRSKIFRHLFRRGCVKPACHRQDEKSCRKRGRGCFSALPASKGVFRAPARVTFGRSPKSDQKVCLKPKVSRLPARYAV